jgi:hypothetical protein
VFGHAASVQEGDRAQRRQGGRGDGAQAARRVVSEHSEQQGRNVLHSVSQHGSHAMSSKTLKNDLCLWLPAP